MSHKVLVTGAGGYIGSITTYQLLQKDYQVVAVDNFSTGYIKPLEVLQEKFGDKLSFYNLSTQGDLSKVFKENNIASIIHFAASCLVDESMKDPQKYFTNNVSGTINLLKYALENNVKNIVFSSTCAVYGEAEYIPIDENHPTNPTTPYGLSKRMVEQILQWYQKIYGLKFISLRYFNVCGASDDSLIGDSKNPSVLLVQNAVRGALNIEPFFLTCPEVDTPDKTPIRDYVNVVDLAEAHIKALEYLLNDGNSAFINLGTGTGSSVLEIVEAVQKVTGVKFEINKGQSRQGETAKMIADIKKAKQVLGWEPQRSIEDSIKSLVKWYKNHPKGWQD